MSGLVCSNCGAQLLQGVKFCRKCGTPVQSIAPARQTSTPQPAPIAARQVSLNEAASFARERISKGTDALTVVTQLVNWGVPESNAKSIVDGIEGEVLKEKKKRWRSTGVKTLATGLIILVMFAGTQYEISSRLGQTLPSPIPTFLDLVELIALLSMVAGAGYLIRSFA